MEPHDLLEKYIRKYYADWLGCSRRWCSQFGIYAEAYDLFADVLEWLCNMKPERLYLLIAHEESGDRWLFFLMRKVIRTHILRFRKKTCLARCCSLDMWSDIQQEIDAVDIPVNLFNEFREVEAKFRGDDFIDAGRQYDGNGRLTRYITRWKKGDGITYGVKYQATATDGYRRQYSRRTSAIAFLARHPPPNDGLQELKKLIQKGGEPMK